MARAQSPASAPSSANGGFGAELRLAAAKLRHNLDAAIYSLHEDTRTRADWSGRIDAGINP